MKKAEHQLEKLTDNHRNGIRGVSVVTITPAKNEFNLSTWWKNASEDNKKLAGVPQKPKNDFTLLYLQGEEYKKATATYWEKIHSKESKEAGDAKKSIPNINPKTSMIQALIERMKSSSFTKISVNKRGNMTGKRRSLKQKLSNSWSCVENTKASRIFAVGSENNPRT